MALSVLMHSNSVALTSSLIVVLFLNCFTILHVVDVLVFLADSHSQAYVAVCLSAVSAHESLV